MAILDFVKPDKILVTEFSNKKGIFHLKPLEPGYGITLGNSLRRVLLSSLKGFAVTSIKIEGVKYEFSTIKGVAEDVTEIVLNFKKIRLKQIIPGTQKEVVNVVISEKEKIITGKILNKFILGFQILNHDLVICNKEEFLDLKISFTIEEGRGYVPAEEHKKENYIIGTIPIDSIFTPIVNVKYSVESCRVKQKTDFEDLSLEIKTDGSILPKKALMEASKILIQYLSIFSSEKIDKKEKVKIKRNKKKYNEEFSKMRTLLKSKLSEMDLSVRTKNCLKLASINTIEELVNCNRNSMLKMRNFGKKSLDELEGKMKEKGLYFGMKTSDYKLNTNEKNNMF
ncbi:DNA-directed RNA polymerase subunit alpha [Blattabacterium cuenoti]|uniref:DNA-directed RNA polymerase subunit alpha n=1 Tax=Blattabacterium cuenoti TaxID=1653831 RepID=UPI00163C6549|nr:DNA-directed RNA polymerase subunit alpha [Blattabacterium cuenoti]